MFRGIIDYLKTWEWRVDVEYWDTEEFAARILEAKEEWRKEEFEKELVKLKYAIAHAPRTN
jgi:hypothetical protein